MKWLGRGLAALLGFLLVLPVAALAFLYSDAGTRWLLNLTQELVPELRVAAVRGSLLSRLEIEGLSYRDQGLTFDSERLELDWQPTQLLRGQLHVKRLWLTAPRLILPPAEPSEPGEPFVLPEEIALPVTVRVDEVGQERGVFAEIPIDRLRLTAAWDAQGLRVSGLRLVAPQGEINGELGAQPRMPYALDADIDWGLTLPETPALAGHLNLRGDLSELVAGLAVAAPLNTRVDARLRPDLAGGKPWADIQARWASLAWPPVGLRSDAGDLSVQGTAEQLRMKLAAAVDLPDLPLRRVALRLDGRALRDDAFAPDLHLRWSAVVADQPPLSGEGSVSGDLRELNIVHQLDAPVHFTTRGRLGLAEDQPRFDVSGEWTDLRWPLVGESEFRSPSGSYSASGTPEAYHLQTDLQAEGEGIPPLKAETRISGGMSAATVEMLRVDTLGGTLRADGKVAWQPLPAWDVRVDLRDLHPERMWPGWPGVISAQASVDGEAGAGGLQLNARLEKLAGELQGRPLAGQGRVEMRGERLRVEGLWLSSGANRLELTGRLGPDLDAAFVIDAPKLAELAPGLAGRLQGKGSLGGSYQAPVVIADLDGEGLRFQGYGLRSVELKANVDPANADVSSARLRLKRADLDGFRLDNLGLDVDGNLERHRLSLSAKGDDGLALDLLAAGGYTEARWQGTLQRLEAVRDKIGRWRLAAPVALTASADRVSAGQACLLPDSGRVCVRGAWNAADGVDADGRIEGLPLALAQPWLPEEVSLEGRLEAHFAASGQGESLRARAELAPFDAALAYTAEDDAPLRAEFRNRRTTLIYGKQALDAELDWQVGQQGSIQGKVGLGAPDANGARPLRGGADLRLPDPGPVTAFVPSLKELSGGLAFTARLAGTTDRPDVRLHGEWADGRAALPELGLVLEQVQVKVDNDGDDRYRLDAQLASGPGRLAVKGEVRLVEPGWTAEFSAKGEDFQVLKRPDLAARISPDVRIKADPESVSMTGKITVPQAKAVVAEVPKSAVTVSSDEVIVGEAAQEEPEPAGGPKVSADVRIVLGQDVSLEAFGLKTNLGGDLRVRQRPGAQPQAVGFLQLKNGNYKAYGQDLTIEEGRLLFSGPVDNPDVNLRAIRKSGDVTAGIRVQGPLRKPRSQVYAEPAMAEAEALSYLLTGGPISGGGKADAAALAEAAVGLGLEKAGLIGQDLGTSVGVDELTVASDGGLDSSAVVIGKQLTPDLYLRYLYGLFDRDNEVQLRYQLSRSLSLEGSSGTNQAVDLIYSIETN